MPICAARVVARFRALLLLCAALAAGQVPAGETEWDTHNKAGSAAYRTGDYGEAAARFEAALRELETFDPSVFRQTLTLNNLAAVYQSLGRHAEAEPLYRRSLAIREEALGPDHADVGTAVNNLAALLNSQGRSAEAEPLFRRNLAIREKVLGPNHPDVGTALHNLAVLVDSLGRHTEAEPMYRRDLAISEKAYGPNHLSVGITLTNLAELLRAQGNLAEAEPLFVRGLAIQEKSLGRLQGGAQVNLAAAANNLATLYRAQGRYAEAEPLYRRSLAIREKVLGPEHPHTGTTLGNLAELYRAQGRYADAEPLTTRSLAILERALGPDHQDVGTTLNNLALLYDAQGRHADAEKLYRRDLAISEKKLGPGHPNVATTLSNLAELVRAQGRNTEAEPMMRRSLAIREQTLGPDHPDTGASLNNLASLYNRQGRIAEAEQMYRRSFGIIEKNLGPNHPDAAMAMANVAKLHAQQKHWEQGLPLIRRATQMLATRFTARSASERSAVRAEQQARSWHFELHIAMLYGAYGGDARAAAESFSVAQYARASDTAEQLGNMAARYASGSDAIAALARARQDAIARLQGIDVRIVKASSRETKDRDLAAETQLHASAVTAAKEIEELDARMETEYPAFRELTNPKPLELAAAQKLLQSDEAMVLLLVSGDESYLWALRREQAGFFKLAITRAELAGAVKKLRTQLDLGTTDPAIILARPFDVTTAHDLYRKILQPAMGVLVGVKHLVFVPDGALQSLPLGVLVTRAPAKPTAALGEHAAVPWLAKQLAITVLPAASSLRALRELARAPASNEVFGAFGAPLLEGNDAGARSSTLIALYSRGAVADVNDVRKLEPLPESAAELYAIATALKAPATGIRLGAAATERAVKEADLARYRNLAFATHGLMAGEFKGLAEPALVLTPPQTASALDDGLLTASEISQLRLDADWVVLSACNTAAPDGTPGAEGLSGLARAFFYAGARSLLVSHWSVASEATVALTTRMFEEAAKGSFKAEALRRSMVSMMETPGKPQYAHPAFWAPFVVVGEGGVRLP